MTEHLVCELKGTSYAAAKTDLGDVHDFLVRRACAASVALSRERPRWGILAKREEVSLETPDRPGLIGKASERLVEMINMVATIERTLDALSWFSTQPEFRDLSIRECHPSTSSSEDGNDIVLVDRAMVVQVRCEVTDVAANSAGQNGKERRDLRNLGCAETVPRDSVRRFICTSERFAKALSAPTRRWKRHHYCYQGHSVGIEDSMMLEILAGP